MRPANRSPAPPPATWQEAVSLQWKAMSVADSSQVAVLHGDDELEAGTGHLFASVRTEFACAARDPDTWIRARAAHGAKPPFGPVSPARITVRKLLSPAALASEEHRGHLRQIMGRGVQVRISGAALPHETILLDRRVAILAGGRGRAGREYTVTTSPALVAGVDALFQAAWQAATDFGAYLTAEPPVHLDESAREILRLLSTGATDEAAARSLELSLRTYRRRVANLMATLEAGSRFQAGLRAGELGLTR
jgi:DNA-binding NarL/FixJ family response regulator